MSRIKTLKEEIKRPKNSACYTRGTFVVYSRKGLDLVFVKVPSHTSDSQLFVSTGKTLNLSFKKIMLVTLNKLRKLK